jgi:hypothetical protein
LPRGQSRLLAQPIGTYRQPIEIATVPGPHRRAAGINHLVMAEVACQWDELSEPSASDGELAFDAEMTLREYRAGCLNLEWG